MVRTSEQALTAGKAFVFPEESGTPQLAPRASILKFTALAKLMAPILGVLLICSAGLANDVFISQNLAGAGTGADCANALPLTFFNDPLNWPGQIRPGTTVHLCGTITSSLTANGSGIAGNPIIIKFETGAQMSSPVFSTAINLTSRSYIVVDGGTNGIIQNTANGSGLANKLISKAIDISGGNNIEVKNLNFANLYVHTSLSDITVDQTTVNCIYANGFGNNITFDNNTAHETGWCVTLLPGSGQSATGISIYNNNIYNSDHGIALGLNSVTGTPSSVSIHDNHFHDAANWDTTANTYHHDGIHVYAYCGDGVAVCAAANWSGISIYNNLFDGNWGVNNTAHVFFEGNIRNTDIYNNVSIGFGSVNLSNGALYVRSSNTRILNNTIVGGGLATQTGALVTVGGPNTIVRNNLITNADQLIATSATGGGVTSSFTFSNNGYLNGGGNAFVWCPGSCTFLGFGSFATWTSLSGETASVTATNANLDSTGRPLSNSAAIGAGANLTSLGIAALNSDKTGSPRPASGAWDAGAYQFAAIPPDFSMSASPASQAVVQGSSTSYSVGVTASGGFTGTVSLSVSGLPAGAAASFNPTSVATSGSSTLTVTAGSTTATSSYPFTITGASGALTHSTSVTLVVTGLQPNPPTTVKVIAVH